MNLFTFTEEILSGKLHSLCSENHSSGTCPWITFLCHHFIFFMLPRTLVTSHYLVTSEITQSLSKCSQSFSKTYESCIGLLLKGSEENCKRQQRVLNLQPLQFVNEHSTIQSFGCFFTLLKLQKSHLFRARSSLTFRQL